MGRSALSLVFIVAGDMAVYLASTVLGFASHGELEAAAAGRMLATWLPFSAAWFAVALWLGLFDRERLARPSQLWRAAAASLAAAPLGAWLRSLWLGGGVVWVFVVVMAAVTGGLMLLWRALVGLALRKRTGRP
jgi:hypothetical protein